MPNGALNVKMHIQDTHTRMKITINNKTIEAEVCNSLLSKAKGLMFSFSSKPRPLLFIFSKEEIYSLHMLFVFFPIDVLFLDSSKRIVELKNNFLPFTFYKPKNKARYIIELPKGSITKYHLNQGMKAIFK